MAPAGSRTGREGTSTAAVCTGEKTPVGRWGGVRQNWRRRGGSGSLIDRITCCLSCFLLSHALRQPHAPLPSPPMAGAWATSLGLVPTCQSPILHIALGRDVPFPFPSGAAHLYPFGTRGPEPSPASLAEHTIPNRPESCAYPCKHSPLEAGH